MGENLWPDLQTDSSTLSEGNSINLPGKLLLLIQNVKQMAVIRTLTKNRIDLLCGPTWTWCTSCLVLNPWNNEIDSQNVRLDGLIEVAAKQSKLLSSTPIYIEIGIFEARTVC